MLREEVVQPHKTSRRLTFAAFFHRLVLLEIFAQAQGKLLKLIAFLCIRIDRAQGYMYVWKAFSKRRFEVVSESSCEDLAINKFEWDEQRQLRSVTEINMYFNLPWIEEKRSPSRHRTHLCEEGQYRRQQIVRASRSRRVFLDFDAPGA